MKGPTVEPLYSHKLQFISSRPVHMIGKRTKNQTEVDPSWSIGVPHGFFKTVISPKKGTREHYVFNHSEDLEGCGLNQALDLCSVKR